MIQVFIEVRITYLSQQTATHLNTLQHIEVRITYLSQRNQLNAVGLYLWRSSHLVWLNRERGKFIIRQHDLCANSAFLGCFTLIIFCPIKGQSNHDERVYKSCDFGCTVLGGLISHCTIVFYMLVLFFKFTYIHIVVSMCRQDAQVRPKEGYTLVLGYELV